MSNIPAGYKHTEVGVIPEDWEALELGDIFKSMQLGGNYKNSERETSCPLIKMGNLGRGSIKLYKLEFIDSSQPPSSRDKLEEDDVLFNTRNTLDLVGKVAIWRNELPEAYFNSNIMRMGFDKARVSSNRFMNYILNTPQSLKGLRGIAIGTTSVAAIYSRDFVRLKVPLPPKAEQTAIATALSDADALIASLEKLIAKKRKIKQGAMQELLKPKEGWVVKKLGEIGSFSKGQGIRKDECISGTISCVRYGELYTRHNDYVKQYYSFISESVAQTAKKLKPGDILFAGSGETKEEIGKCAAFIDNIEAYAGGDIVILSPANVDSLFLGFYLNTPSVVKQKASKGQGDAVVHISAGNLKDIEIPIPPLSEQTRIATILSDMDAEIEGLEKKLEKYRRIKQGMMQELLTGKTRLV